jgi:hypothetical protein
MEKKFTIMYKNSYKVLSIDEGNQYLWITLSNAKFAD